MVMLYDADGWRMEGVLALAAGDIVLSGSTPPNVTVDDWGSAGAPRQRRRQLHVDRRRPRTCS
jgi:hypothetical protein